MRHKRRLDQVSRQLPPPTKPEPDFSALSDEELEELETLVLIIQDPVTQTADLRRLTREQLERWEALTGKIVVMEPGERNGSQSW